MTIQTIEKICKHTRTKEKLKKYISAIKEYEIEVKTQILRVIVPYKMFPIFQDKRFKFCWGGRWGSKTHSIGKALLYLADQKKCRILCTREIQNTLAESVHAELKTLIFELDYLNYKVTEKGIYNEKTKSEFLFKGLQQQDRRQTIKSLSGIDYCWVEEAQTISKSSLDILVPTIRKAGSELWFSYNQMLPDDPVESLRLSIPEEEKIEVNILAFDNPFISKETQKDIDRLKDQYDKGINEDYLHVVLGHPASLSDRVILTLKEVYDTIDRDIKDEGAIEIGVDVARFGKDRTIFFKRKGMKIIDWKVYKKKSVTEVAGLLVDFVGRHNTDIMIKIDDTGLGGGVTDIMIENGYNIWPIIYGAKSTEPDKYNNLITEMWFYFKSIIEHVSLPDIQELKSELTTREYKIDMKGRKQIESKEDYRKKYNKSPDFADSLLMCFYENTFADAHFFGKGV